MNCKKTIGFGERVHKRMKTMSDLGLVFDGENYKYKDINFHRTELLCDTDEEWNKKINDVTIELKRRASASIVNG